MWRLSISNDIVSTKIYDKRDDFDFKIEGVATTRCFSPLLVKIELASFSIIKKNISAQY